MVRKYKVILVYVGYAFLYPSFLISQEPKIFTKDDFDLNGKVKSCLVITDYGKEEFDFNRKGQLTKSVTRYSAQDYDINYYMYHGGHLRERRDESYRDGALDRVTSMAHFYTRDTVPQKKVTEKILSYNKDFLDNYEYHYGPEGRLVRIIHSSQDRLDETTVAYEWDAQDTTTTYSLNGVLLKSVKITNSRQDNDSVIRKELVREYMEGLLIKADETWYDSFGQIIRELSFDVDPNSGSMIPFRELVYSYKEQGILSEVTTKKDHQNSKKEFIYQFDSNAEGNWVKKIVTPDNAYTTRRITYYEDPAGEPDPK